MDDVLLACADANFVYKPLRLKEHPDTAYGKFTAQRFSYAETGTDDFKVEWIITGSRIILLDDSISRDALPPKEEIPVEIIDPVDSVDPGDDDDPWF